MALSPDQEQALIDALADPTRKTSVDGLTAEAHSLGDVIKALNWHKQCSSVESRTTRPFRIQHLRSPGTIYGT